MKKLIISLFVLMLSASPVLADPPANQEAPATPAPAAADAPAKPAIAVHHGHHHHGKPCPKGEGKCGPMGGGMMMHRMFDRMDSNHDGKISRSEFMNAQRQMFARMDANDDGYITMDEMKERHTEMMEKHHEMMEKHHGMKHGRHGWRMHRQNPSSWTNPNEDSEGGYNE